MKRTILFALAAITLLACYGCNGEDSKPVITRSYGSPACGVVPLAVDFYGIASGGDESGDPTGGNNNLEFSWNFGDGTQGSSTIAYHTYTVPGEYTVTVTATDPNGETATASMPITVVPDSLVIEASYEPMAGIDTATDVLFDFTAFNCAVDPSNPDDYRQLVVTWEMNDPGFPDLTYSGRNPRHRFSAAGDYDVRLSVFFPAEAVMRRTSLNVSVSDVP